MIIPALNGKQDIGLARIGKMPNIPLISGDISKGIIASMEHDADYFQNLCDRLKVQNPLIYYMITAAQEHSNEDFATGYIKGVCTAYVLIEAQMDADEMNAKWG